MVGDGGLVHQAAAPRRRAVRLREHRDEAEIAVACREGTEMILEIEVALGTNAAIEIDRLRHAGGERALDDRLDGRQARAAGDGENRSPMPLAQKRAAVGSCDLDRIADAQLLGDVDAGAATGGPSDVEFELGIVGAIRHRIVAWRLAGEAHRRVLTGRETERAARRDGETQPPDIVGHIIDRDDATGRVAQRVGDRLVGVEPGEADVAPWHGATGEDQPIAAFRRAESEFRAGRQIDRAGFEARLAGAAIARATAVRIGDAGFQRRLKDRLADRHAYRRAVLANGGKEAHPRYALIKQSLKRLCLPIVCSTNNY